MPRVGVISALVMLLLVMFLGTMIVSCSGAPVSRELQQVLSAESAEDALGLPPSGWRRPDVHAAFRRRALEFHPDKHCPRGDRAACAAAQDAMIKISAARDELLREDSTARQYYPDAQQESSSGESGEHADDIAAVLMFMLLLIPPAAIHVRPRRGLQRSRATRGWTSLWRAWRGSAERTCGADAVRRCLPLGPPWWSQPARSKRSPSVQ